MKIHSQVDLMTNSSSVAFVVFDKHRLNDVMTTMEFFDIPFHNEAWNKYFLKELRSDVTANDIIKKSDDFLYPHLEEDIENLKKIEDNVCVLEVERNLFKSAKLFNIMDKLDIKYTMAWGD